MNTLAPPTNKARSDEWEVVVRFRSSPKAGSSRLSKIRARLAQHSRLDGYKAHRVYIALEEAITNAKKHAGGWDPSKFVTVRCEVAADCLNFEIEDEGSGFNPDDIADPRDPKNLENWNGRGLMLMRHYMSTVTFHFTGKGTRVVMTKDLTI